MDDLARILAERRLPGSRGGPLVWSWIVVIPVAWLWLMMGWGDQSGIALLLFGVILLTSRLVANLSAYGSASRTALLMAELDREWTGPLIDALSYGKSAMKQIARLRLLTVLPTLDESDAAALSPGRRALLFDHLTPWAAYRDPDLVRAILRFGARAGDEEALAGVERLAAMRAFSSGQRVIRQEARGLLVGLVERIAVRSAGMSNSASRSAVRPKESERNLSDEARSWLADIEAESVKRPAMRFGFLLASWGVILPYAVYMAIDQFRNGSLLLALLFAIAGVLATQLYRLALRPQQMRLAAKLGSVDNVEAVGPLAEMTGWPDERIQSRAIAALTRLLPRLRSSDTQLLTPFQRSLLYQWLTLPNARRRAEFQIALLSALEQVGDPDALPYVRTLASEQPATLRQRQVVEAANGCLPYLEGCADQNRHTQTLLRPVTIQISDTSLLRPAVTALDVNPDLLVRSAAPTESR